MLKFQVAVMAFSMKASQFLRELIERVEAGIYMPRSSWSLCSHVKIDQGKDILFAHQKKGQPPSWPVNCKMFVSYFFMPSKVRNRSTYFLVSNMKEAVCCGENNLFCFSSFNSRQSSRPTNSFIVNNVLGIC